MYLFNSRDDALMDNKAVTQLGTAVCISQDNPVVSVRVQLLVRSLEDNVLEEPQVFKFPDDTAQTSTDRRMRQVFTNTVAIRSRLP